MRVIRATRAGFCMGVSLALKKLDGALADFVENGGASRICTLGPIIHNPSVLEHFAGRGVHCLGDVSEALGGDCVLIRAHGVPRQEEADLRLRCHAVKDATCPKVKKAQLAIEGNTASGAVLLLFGEAEHPEVRGLVSYASGRSVVFSSSQEIDTMELDEGQAYVLASQTTQDREAFDLIAASLARRLPRLSVLSTICDATRERQAEAMRIAEQADKMVVVGGKASGNTRRLASLAANAGIETFHVESVRELDARNFRDVACVGLTAGASTPGALIDEVEAWLEAI